MIWLTKLDGSALLLNADQIVSIEVPHDTILSLANGDKLRVLETPEQIVERIVLWRRRTLGLAWLDSERLDEGG